MGFWFGSVSLFRGSSYQIVSPIDQFSQSSQLSRLKSFDKGNQLVSWFSSIQSGVSASGT